MTKGPLYRPWWTTPPRAQGRSCCCTSRTDPCADTCHRSHVRFQRVLLRASAKWIRVQGTEWSVFLLGYGRTNKALRAAKCHHVANTPSTDFGLHHAPPP